MVLGDISDSTILFDALREKAEHLENKEEIKERISDMEKCAGKKSFVEKYNAFIQSVANHMTIFAPFIPMLTELLPKVWIVIALTVGGVLVCGRTISIIFRYKSVFFRVFVLVWGHRFCSNDYRYSQNF